MITVKQAAEKLGLSPGRIQQLIKIGHINARKYGPMWMIKEEDLRVATWNRKPGPKT